MVFPLRPAGAERARVRWGLARSQHDRHLTRLRAEAPGTESVLAGRILRRAKARRAMRATLSATRTRYRIHTSLGFLPFQDELDVILCSWPIFPSPLAGEGQGGGCRRKPLQRVAEIATPHLNPPPQGGRTFHSGSPGQMCEYDSRRSGGEGGAKRAGPSPAEGFRQPGLTRRQGLRPAGG